MITRLHKILIGLLVVQIALAVLLLNRSEETQSLAERPLLAGFDAAKVTRVKIWDKDTPQPAVELVKKGDAWELASAFDYPVPDNRVSGVLATLVKASAAAPMATQETRHRQLKVADHEFERKVTLTVGGKDITVFLGNASGARRTAMRIGGSNDVYAASDVNWFTFGNSARMWADPEYIDVPKDDVAKVTIERAGTKIELVRNAPPAAGSGSAESAPAGWTATIGGAPIVLAAGEKLDEAKLDTIVGSAAKIELTAPTDPKRDASHPTATITIERKSGATSPAPVVVDAIADGASYWVHQRGATKAILADKSALETVVELDRDKLVIKPAPAAGSGSAAGPPHPATGS